MSLRQKKQTRAERKATKVAAATGIGEATGATGRMSETLGRLRTESSVFATAMAEVNKMGVLSTSVEEAVQRQEESQQEVGE
jgi:hypothetical protein